VLNADLIVPEDADVAGAIGAAVGSIRQSARVTITQPSDGTYRVHLIKGPVDFANWNKRLIMPNMLFVPMPKPKQKLPAVITLI
jgi:hypothetical protein